MLKKLIIGYDTDDGEGSVLVTMNKVNEDGEELEILQVFQYETADLIYKLLTTGEWRDE